MFSNPQSFGKSQTPYYELVRRGFLEKYKDSYMGHIDHDLGNLGPNLPLQDTGNVYDLYSSIDPTQETRDRSCRFHGSRPATRARRVQIRNLSSVKHLQHEEGIDDLSMICR